MKNIGFKKEFSFNDSITIKKALTKYFMNYFVETTPIVDTSSIKSFSDIESRFKLETKQVQLVNQINY